MKAIRIHAHGGPEVLRYEDVPDPEPRTGEAVVRVAAAGLNYIDVYHRTGLYKLGPLSAHARLRGGGHGDGRRRRRLAPYVSATASPSPARRARTPNAWPCPPNGSSPCPGRRHAGAAAAAMLQGMTAHYLARSTYPLRPGDTCLVHAAAGGVGLLLCQIAKRRGARVIGTVSTRGEGRRSRARPAPTT